MLKDYLVKTLSCASAALALLASTPVLPQDSDLWICNNPKTQPLYVARDIGEKDEQTPPCIDWLQVRGSAQFSGLYLSLNENTYSDANLFARDVFQFRSWDYPVTESGSPLRTIDLYTSPSVYGLRPVPIEQATLGSTLIYDGLAGILVETRRENSQAWIRQVIYPSASAGFNLRVASPFIPGKQEPFAIEGK